MSRFNRQEWFLYSTQTCRARLEEAERELDRLEGQSEGFSGTTDEETEMLETLKAQHEAVEAERKVSLQR